MMLRPFVLLFCISFGSAAGITTDENAMFGDTTQIADSASLVQNAVSKESEREKNKSRFVVNQ